MHIILNPKMPVMYMLNKLDEPHKIDEVKNSLRDGQGVQVQIMKLLMRASGRRALDTVKEKQNLTEGIHNLYLYFRAIYEGDFM